MIRLLLSILLLLFSLLAVLPIPARQLWYAAIAVSEFPWVWLVISFLLLLWVVKVPSFRLPSLLVLMTAMVLFATPIIRAYGIASGLDERLQHAFRVGTGELAAPHRDHAFSLAQMITGIGASKVPFTSYEYAVHSGVHLSLDLYPSQVAGVRPCLLVVHGGSWKSGNNGELPDVNSYFAKAGYQVATINYRLAPEFKSPAPQEDVHAALQWLRQNASRLNIDPNNFVLMGRSAGGQIVLEAAYGLNEPGVKGVVSFYGPADMIFGYQEPHNQLVMKHREVLEAFLGGPPDTYRQQYLDASPVAHVTDTSIPALLVHGHLDQHVHYAESERMAAVLQQHHIPHLLLGLPWATHGCEYSLNGPSGQLAVYAVERFLQAVTRPGGVGK